jgi:hypothetical protein
MSNDHDTHMIGIYWFLEKRLNDDIQILTVFVERNLLY